ncbi:hypothetical protein [Sulfurimonas sp.]
MNIENLSLKEILYQTTLYEVYENHNGELGYKLDSNGNKIEICEIGDIEFANNIQIFNYELGYIVKISKSLNINESEQSVLEEGNIPLFTANINPVKYICNIDDTKLIKSSDNKIISFATNGDGSAGRNFVIHNSDFFINADRIAIQVTKKLYYKYLFYCIYNMRQKYGYNRKHKAIDKNLKKDIKVKIPQPYKNYSSFEMQLAIVKNIEEKIEKIRYKEKILELMDTLNRQKIILLLNNFFDKKIEDSIIVEGATIKLSDIEFEEVEAHKSNEYFIINNGQRLKKSDLEESKDGMVSPVEVYSASEFNEHVFGYIEKEKLELINPNQHVYKGKTILLNTGGSVGAIRYKNNDFEYTVIDNVAVYIAEDNKSHPTYLYYALQSIMDNSKFDFNNTLRGEDLSKANLIIKIPKYKNTNTYKLQEAISKYLEDRFNEIDIKFQLINKIKIVLRETEKQVLEVLM